MAWITHRDRIGEVIESYGATHPTPAMREAIEVVEADLNRGDHAVGLL